MKKANVLVWATIVWSLIASDEYLYDAYQRDLIIALDWAEESFRKNFLSEDENKNYGAIFIDACQALYDQAAPAIISWRLWERIRASADFVEQILNIPETNNQEAILNLANYYAAQNVYKNTVLKDSNYLKQFFPVMQKFNRTYQAIVQEIKNKKSITIIKELLKREARYTTELQTINPELWRIAKICFISKIIVDKVKQDKIAIYSIADRLLLFISPSYVKKITAKICEIIGCTNNNFSKMVTLKVKNRDDTERLAEQDEIVTQLKIKNFPLLENPFIPKHSGILKKDPNVLVGDILEKLIITKQELETFDDNSSHWKPYLCQWNIYGTGHGDQETIMGLRITTFTKMLESLAKLPTKFFCYTSCYAAGFNSIQAYQNEKKEQLQLPYTTVLGSITDAPTIGYTPKFIIPPFDAIDSIDDNINMAKQEYQPTFSANFREFFSDLHRGNYIFKNNTMTYVPAPPFAETINKLFHFYWKYVGEIRTLANYPQIRFPGSNWFNALNLPTVALHITPLLVSTKAAEKKPLYTFITEKRGILQKEIKERSVVLIDAFARWKSIMFADYDAASEPYSASVTVPLIIGKTMPAIVCTAPQETTINFTEIDAESIGITEFFRKFLGVEKTNLGRLYYCKKLTLNTSEFSEIEKALLGVYSKEISVENVLIYANYGHRYNKYNKLVFSHKDKNYQIVLNYSDDVADFIKKSKERPTITEFHEKIDYPHFIQEYESLGEAQRALLGKDKQFKQELKALSTWIKSLPSNERLYLQRFNYYIIPSKEPLSTPALKIKKQSRVQDLIAKYLKINPQYRKKFIELHNDSKNKEFLENFDRLYSKFQEFSKWRSQLSKEQENLIIDYYQFKKQLDLTAVASLLQRNLKLIDKYNALKNDIPQLQTWLQQLAAQDPVQYQVIKQYEKALHKPDLVQYLNNLSLDINSLLGKIAQ